MKIKKIIPKGQYTARVVKAEVKTSIHSDIEYVVFTYRIQKGKYTGHETTGIVFMPTYISTSAQETLFYTTFDRIDVCKDIPENDAEVRAVLVTINEIKPLVSVGVVYSDSDSGSINTKVLYNITNRRNIVRKEK